MLTQFAPAPPEKKNDTIIPVGHCAQRALVDSAVSEQAVTAESAVAGEHQWDRRGIQGSVRRWRR